MNTKKNKNKNRPNKPVILNPLENVEEGVPTKKEVEVKQKMETIESVPKIEKRVPEVISEVDTQRFPDKEEKNYETPKKPKRNRGKKKHQESDVEADSRTINVASEASPEVLPDAYNVTPCVPKKKNKSKKLSEATENVSGVEMKSVNKNTALTVEGKSTETVAVKEEVVDFIFENQTEQEGTPSKKKNKKKKHRTDSEKSEKVEALSCISAFQKLLKNEICDVAKVDTVKEIDNIVTSTSQNENIKTGKNICNVQDTTLQKDNILNQGGSNQENIFDSSKQSVSESAKGTKKNKKDKKNSQKEGSLIDITSEMEVKATTESISEPISHQVTEKAHTEDLVHIDDSCEVKAKIVRTIERKRKEKGNKQIKDLFPETSVKDCDIVRVGENLQDNEKQNKEDTHLGKTSPKVTPQVSIVKLDTHASAKRCVLSDFDEGKKRNKSPNPKLDNPIKDPNPIQISDLSQSIEMKTKIENVTSEIHIPIEQNINEAKRSVSNIGSLIEDDKKMKKDKNKSKKSQKLPIDQNIDTKKKVSGDDSIKEGPIPYEHTKEKIESTCGSPSFEEIEISSLKADESEGSDICGFQPDILYPRATSQDFTDNNNNMTSIQEIALFEETKLQIPLVIPDTPLICGSGETPIDTPEIVVASNIHKDEKIKTQQQSDKEKTDLKSKMMEVNQDMEDLRLSIEKSLAELTILEKTEAEVEDDFVNKNLIIKEETLPIGIQQQMPCSVVEIKSEKEESSLQLISKSQESISIEDNPLLFSHSSSVQSKDENLKDITDSIAWAAISDSVSDFPITTEKVKEPTSHPTSSTRKDHKNNGKSKKKGKKDSLGPSSIQLESRTNSTQEKSIEENKTEKTEEKIEQKPDSLRKQGKQQSELSTADNEKSQSEQRYNTNLSEFESIEKFEDAMTSSADDINKSFEMIANEVNQVEASHVNPEINITAPIEDTKQEEKGEKVNPLSQPKNLLGHPNIPAPSSRVDYKKEKNKSPNEIVAKVKIKDSIAVEVERKSKESQTDNIRKFLKNKSKDESISLVNDNEDFIYKYSFRKVFLQSVCHVCKKDLKQSRVACNYCSLVFYCTEKHKDDDWPQHQALCFAVSTIGHLKDLKHIYADAKNVTGQNYRLLRMQMIISCEKVLKRRLLPWEQEALLYPRICADIGCREWRQGKLVDCAGCGQISYCSAQPGHLPKTHQRWCNSYNLYQKLVSYQQTKGRLEPKLPSKVLTDYQIPEKINEILAAMYEEKIDMNDIQYAALTQIATAPLTAAYCYQIANKAQQFTNGISKTLRCTLHVVDAQLQFEADALNKWEVFFLHVVPVAELRVVMISTNLNPGNLPLELLSKIKLCENCRLNNRKVIFNFHDKQSYHEYWAGEDYIIPNIVCAFNANIDRCSTYNTKADPWPKTINCILKQRVPFLLTAHTLNEILKDLTRIKQYAEHELSVLVEPTLNSFASVRPDRNFITDDEMPLLFNNYCYLLLTGLNN